MAVLEGLKVGIIIGLIGFLIGVSLLTYLKIADILSATNVILERKHDHMYDKKYGELIGAVESKYENETRHETALKYIKRCEG